MANPVTPRRDARWLPLALLLLVALAARAVTVGSPVVHVDEAFYLTVADMMHHGAIPYVDIWDRKPVGLFLLYWPAALFGLPAALYAYQAMAGAAVVATAWLVMRLAERAGWRAGAVPAAILYILWLDLGDGQGGQTPVFYNLLMAGAALLVLRAVAESRRRSGIAAMLLVGLAIQIKYTVLFEGIGFGLWLVWSDWRVRRSIASSLGYASSLIVVALLPTAAALIVYALIGHLDAFIYANFISILHRGKDALPVAMHYLQDDVGILLPLILSVAAWRRPGAHAAAGPIRAWLILALIAFIGFGGWYNHYTLPVMLPGAVCAAAFFERRRQHVLWAAIPLALVFVAGQKILASERGRRGTAAEFAALAQQVGRGPGTLFIYSGPVLLYPATGRPTPTPYIFPSHLEFMREAGSIGVDQAAEIDRIFRQHPAVVVMAPPIDDEKPAIRARVMAWLNHGGYRAGAPILLGRDRLLVFRRPATS